MKRTLWVYLSVAVFMLGGFAGEAASYNTYFGDIHGHSDLSDGCNPADQYYQNAQINGLDFAALTDHGEQLDSSTWQTVMNLASQYNKSNLFVTFIGYEWTSGSYGHKTVIFADTTVPALPYGSVFYSTPENLWSALTNNGFLDAAVTIPHHPAGGPAVTKWANHSKNYEPVAEIISKHGNSEYSVNNPNLPSSERFEQIDYYFANDNKDHSVSFAVNILGYHLGVIGGTDTHDANPGSVYSLDTCKSEHKYHGGLMAVLADNLTRADLWNAIKARRVYATSGPKVTLSFTINDNPMGSEISLSTNPELHFAASVPSGGSMTITSVQILKDGHAIVNVPVNGQSVEKTWQDIKFTKSCNYSIKVKLQDSSGNAERAWSSPIWVIKL